MTATIHLDFYPFNYKDTVLIEDDLAVVGRRFNSKEPVHHLCGYCIFRKEEIPPSWWGDYNADGLQYLRVHGGITYASIEGDYVVFGFDCAHCYDDKNEKLKEPLYVLELARDMRHLISMYASRIHEYRGATFHHRVEILDEINHTSQIPGEEMGFGAILGMLGGFDDIVKGSSDEDAVYEERARQEEERRKQQEQNATMTQDEDDHAELGV
jgi:hypothetical protein